MNELHVHAAAAKLENALKVFQTTVAGVDEQWADAARRDFEELYLARAEPSMKAMLAVIGRLGTVFSAAQSHCRSRYGIDD